jgi:polyphenol oxidase
MSFRKSGLIEYYTCDDLPSNKLIHGVFTRRGGVSPSPWDSLNLGGMNGDHKSNIIENRKRVFDAVGLPVESIYDVWQVHGTDVICTDRPRPLDTPHLRADAIITDTPGVTLFMRFGDCVPIFLYDPVHQVIGMVHAGWIGTVQKLVKISIGVMQVKYNSIPEEIQAVIGPSIGPDHYQIGVDVEKKVKDSFSVDSADLLPLKDHKIYFNLWKANQYSLQEAGVTNIYTAGICTACHLQDWYSHRSEHGNTGRFGALIALL